MVNNKPKIVIVGGGAAGFFTAINIAAKNTNYEVIIIEKSNKLLSKVKVSGGGRCNVTNGRTNPAELVKFYPRGHKKLYAVFKTFSSSDTQEWLLEKGVPIKTEDDLRVFPTSNSSQSIIDCFLSEAHKHGIQIQKNCALDSLQFNETEWCLYTNNGEIRADKVVIATGPSHKIWKILTETGLEISQPVPSLFTFNIKDDARITGLQGISFEQVGVKVAGTRLIEEGPLLITHWGISGPSVLKLSSWGARDLADKNYHFDLLINYLPPKTPDKVKEYFLDEKKAHPTRKVYKYPIDALPKRFWEKICFYCEIDQETVFGELSGKKINKLTEELTQGLYRVSGKSTFKEEFVTCGGVKLSEINLQTFESKKFKNLFLAGEVLDIDALTGGFNFQACWSAGWIISESI